MKKWKLKSSKPIFESKYITIRSNDYELPNGALAKEYYHLERPDYVLIIAHKNGKFLIEKQYRRGVDDFIYELPAGWIDKDESPVEAALRELKEETGYTGSAKYLGTLYPQGGFTSMIAYVVEVEVNSEISDRKLEDDENIEFEFMDIENVNSMIKENKFKDMGMLAALELFKQLNLKPQ